MGMEWRVSLAGDESDLNQLSQSFRGPDLAVAREEEGFVLTSGMFSELNSAEAVHEEAENLAVLLNGAVRLALGTPGTVTVGGVSCIGDDGSRSVWIFPPPLSLTLRLFPPTVRITHTDGTVEESNPADPAVGWVKAGLRSEPAAKVLRLLAREPADWGDLYKILEVVEKDMGGENAIDKRGWASQRKRDRFARTANSERHANGKFQPPAHPMSLPDARSFIETVVRNWLAMKQEPPQP